MRLAHHGFLYSTQDEYAGALSAFAREGVDAGEPVLVAVPMGKLALLRGALDGRAAGVTFVDMSEVGRNPARIVPFIAGFLSRHADRHVRFVGEPIWCGRTDAEIAEGVRHEALINLAFADASATIVCPYDIAGLGPAGVEAAAHTHPTLRRDGALLPCDRFRDPLDVYAAHDRPLAPPDCRADARPVSTDLPSLRSWVDGHARAAALCPERTADLVCAANEAVSNTLVHAGGRGTARIWHARGEIVFEVADGGRVVDPLAGRRAPGSRQSCGRGLWLMNHLCDLVELRSGADGTVVRLHMAV